MARSNRHQNKKYNNSGYFQRGVCEKRLKKDSERWRNIDKEQRYIRLDQGLFDSTFTVDDTTGMQKFGSIHTQVPNSTILRPHQSEPSLIEKAVFAIEDKESAKSAELNTYRLFHFGKTEYMFYESYISHHTYRPTCNEKLKFDLSYEVKWGFAWRERLVCAVCGFKSKSYHLYEEIHTSKRGPNAANINFSLPAACMDTPIGNSSMRFLMTSLHTVPPAESGMQRRSNTVADTVEKVAEAGFARVRQQLRTLNKACGLSPQHGIPAAIDSQYNNALRSAGERTPQQPATQVVSTMVEQCTKHQKIIAMTFGNKLKCGQKNNLHESAVIGDENREAHRLMSNILQSEQPIFVDKLTTDGDSQAHKGVLAASLEYSNNATTERLADITHLSKRLLNRLKSTSFSEEMFMGTTKKHRTYLQSRFARDMSHRVNLEFSSLHSACDGDLEKMNKYSPGITQSILECYSGCCGTTCSRQSFVCSGKLPFNWKMDFIPGNAKCFAMNNNDRLLVKNAIMGLRLGPDSLSKTRFKSSTNKIESINRACNVSNPKDTTYPRNAKARKFSAGLRVNEGRANANLEKMTVLGVPIPNNTKTVKVLKNIQDRDDYHKERQSTPKFKRDRFMRRVANFNKYDEIHQADTYKKGMLDT